MRCFVNCALSNYSGFGSNVSLWITASNFLQLCIRKSSLLIFLSIWQSLKKWHLISLNMGFLSTFKFLLPHIFIILFHFILFLLIFVTYYLTIVIFKNMCRTHMTVLLNQVVCYFAKRLTSHYSEIAVSICFQLFAAVLNWTIFSTLTACKLIVLTWLLNTMNIIVFYVAISSWSEIASKFQVVDPILS